MMEDVEDFMEEDNISSSDLFDCEYTSIDAVINQVTVFTGCIERQTENGTRLLVAYGEGINRSAFYTDSKKLRDAFLVPNRKYPMRAVIKVVSYGNMYGFRLFSPKTTITEEDEANFGFYKRTKNRKSR
ncbi:MULTISPECIES: hypothetical protein [Duncaniella]|nr:MULTISPECIES: hypothetical protein [Duncaniella]MCX4283342.1 hypothetical protein [Duncaniella dubosii]